jgi:chromate transporter
MSETAVTSPAPVPAARPSHAELFIAFFKITLSGFGGTLPWTRRMFVEDKKWLTAEEFNDVYAVCQFLPGPNIVNLTSVFGSRMRGVTGAIAAWAGFLAWPFVLMVSVAALYEKFGDLAALRRILAGLAAAAAGLLIATVVKMALPFFRQGSGAGALVFLATAGAIGWMRWPLLPSLLALVPLSIGLMWWSRR